MQALLLFPHQLFRSNASLLKTIGRAFLVEEALFFTQYRFHKKKLVLHRASMQMHAAFLQASGPVEYLEFSRADTTLAALRIIKAAGVAHVHYIDVVDDWLERGLRDAADTCGLALTRHESPMFLTAAAALQQHLSPAHASMARFYASQRVAHQILTEEGRPVGGKWSFDAANRKRLPRGAQVPTLCAAASNQYVEEAQRYIDSHFATNPGRVEPFDYPVTYPDAQRWLQQFIHDRLAQFGDYEDAISTGHAHLYHSVLTPMLNIGLLTPREVIDAALVVSDSVPLNSLEGFIRQVLGWREYMRGAYVYKGRAQRSRNYWNHSRALPQSFWQAKVNIAPVDMVINRVLDSGYAHHIERLMVLANFMVLCEFQPHQIYRWFMEMFIDAYDWVMVPNVYGMGIFADGGLISTKPYLSGSNYLLKMSDLKVGPWCPIWDGLYWRFIAKNRTLLSSNHRMQMTLRSLERMSPSRQEAHIATAEAFLSTLGP